MKKLVSFGLVSMTVLTLGAPFVHAAGEESVAESNATVDFKADTTPVDPNKPDVTDPTDPTTPPGPVDPGDNGAGGTGTKSFTINYVSNFKFGTVNILSSEMTKYANPTTLTFGELTHPGQPFDETNNPYVSGPDNKTGLANFIQVTDTRGLATNGYKLTVATEQFKNNADQTDVLTGAQLFLTGGRLIGSGSAEQAPTNVVAESTDIMANDGAATTILTAAGGKGVGSWTLAWGGTTDDPALLAAPGGNASTGVKLVIPVSAAPQADASYTANLTWTLSDVPA